MDPTIEFKKPKSVLIAQVILFIVILTEGFKLIRSSLALPSAMEYGVPISSFLPTLMLSVLLVTFSIVIIISSLKRKTWSRWGLIAVMLVLLSRVGASTYSTVSSMSNLDAMLNALAGGLSIWFVLFLTSLRIIFGANVKLYFTRSPDKPPNQDVQ